MLIQIVPYTSAYEYSEIYTVTYVSNPGYDGRSALAHITVLYAGPSTGTGVATTSGRDALTTPKRTH